MMKFKKGRARISITFWIILALAILSFYQYNSPEKANEMLNPLWGPVKEFIGSNNPLGSKGNKSSAICPDMDAPVCGDNGKTYYEKSAVYLARYINEKPNDNQERINTAYEDLIDSYIKIGSKDKAEALAKSYKDKNGENDTFEVMRALLGWK